MATGMTKTQLVRYMAEKHEMNNKQAAAFLESLADWRSKKPRRMAYLLCRVWAV